MRNGEATVTKIRKFTDLEAWQASRVLVKKVYDSCSFYPKTEQFGLVSQMKRASISVSSNIAEGFKRDTMKDKIHFYIMAHGSLTELHNQIILSQDLGFCDETGYEILVQLCDKTDRLLTGLIRASKERL